MYRFFFFFLFLTTAVHAQVPTPAPAQSQPILLIGGTAHLGTGEVIENAAVAFTGGKLSVVGAATDIPEAERSSYEVIDASGKHIYPGFILPSTDLGLVEIGAVRATVDRAEKGLFNPNIRSLISYNTDSELIPTFRFNGILLAQIVPQSGVMPGTSSVVQLDAWNWEDAAVTTDNALHLHWPSRFRQEFDFQTFTVKRVPNEKYEEQLRAVRSLFADAKSYATAAEAEANLKLDAMTKVLDGSRTLHLHSDEAREVLEAVLFAEEYGVSNVVLVGGSGLAAVKDFIKEKKIPVVVENVHALPNHNHSDVDALYRLAHDLHEAGITVSLAYREGMTARSRSLPFLAGTAVAYGVDKEVALQMITANTAKILGIDDQVGTLEVGKQATLFISEGDALDMRTNRLTHAFIDGRSITLPAMQQELHQKYKDRYEAASASTSEGE